MTRILSELCDTESPCFCGSACFASLIAFCRPEDEIRNTLLDMIQLDSQVFAACRCKTGNAKEILSRTKQGYQKVLDWIRVRLPEENGILREALAADEAFLQSLLLSLEAME